MAWKDPSSDIMNGIREIAFRTALSASNSSTVQTASATEAFLRAIHASHFGYLGGALVAMILSPILVVPLFIGWWRVDRTVTLSPIEIAKAFRAPLLDGHGCNSNVGSLLKELGTREVKYGVLPNSSQAAPEVDQRGIDGGVQEIKGMNTRGDNGKKNLIHSLE
jgi:hypothetical protein